METSNNPDLTTKMRAALDRYDRPPGGGRVLCIDEFGPLNLQPGNRRASQCGYGPLNRDHGVRHIIASLDLATGKIHYRIRERKRSTEFSTSSNPYAAAGRTSRCT